MRYTILLLSLLVVVAGVHAQDNQVIITEARVNELFGVHRTPALSASVQTVDFRPGEVVVQLSLETSGAPRAVTVTTMPIFDADGLLWITREVSPQDEAADLIDVMVTQSLYGYMSAAVDGRMISAVQVTDDEIFYDLAGAPGEPTFDAAAGTLTYSAAQVSDDFVVRSLAGVTVESVTIGGGGVVVSTSAGFVSMVPGVVDDAFVWTTGNSPLELLVAQAWTGYQLGTLQSDHIAGVDISTDAITYNLNAAGVALLETAS